MLHAAGLGKKENADDLWNANCLGRHGAAVSTGSFEYSRACGPAGWRFDVGFGAAQISASDQCVDHRGRVVDRADWSNDQAALEAVDPDPREWARAIDRNRLLRPDRRWATGTHSGVRQL